MSEVLWRPPGWSSKPPGGPRYLLISKDGESAGSLTLADRALLFGRKVPNEPERGTVRLDHDSISRQHAAIVFSFTGETFAIDLGSRFGTTVDGEKLVAQKYSPIAEGAVVLFGGSTRKYTFTARPPKGAPSQEASAVPTKPSVAASAGDAPPAGRAKPPGSARRPAAAAAGVDDDLNDPMADYVSARFRASPPPARAAPRSGRGFSGVSAPRRLGLSGGLRGRRGGKGS